MAGKCEHIEGCPMFKYFCRAAQTVYKELFCEGNYARCERRKRRTRDEPVPANLLPHGARLWEDYEEPPDLWGESSA